MSEYLYSAGDTVGTGNRIAPGTPRFELAKGVRSGGLEKLASQSQAKLPFPQCDARLLHGTKFVLGDESDVARVLTGSS